MDIVLLKYAIARAGLLEKDVSELLSISKSALYRKMKKETEFTRSEIEQLIIQLDLDSETTMLIFFGDVVS